MILPIVAYGASVLKKKALNIDANYPELSLLISNMFETMYKAHGVGLAAPQIGLSIRLFVVDANPFAEDDETLKNFKRVFINAQIIEESGEKWKFNEGCLSIPGIREDIERVPTIRLKWLDENFNAYEETFTGLKARVIQHEYDHIDGVLFTDRMSQLKKTILHSKLNNISKGKVDVDYKMKFPLFKK
jgi:peptide deformylase